MNRYKGLESIEFMLFYECCSDQVFSPEHYGILGFLLHRVLAAHLHILFMDTCGTGQVQMS